MSKILVETSTKLVKYAFDDDHSVTLDSEKCVAVATEHRKKLIILDMNSSNSSIITGVTVPSGTDVEGDGSTARWYGNKYTYDSGTWTKVSGWEDAPKGYQMNDRFWNGKQYNNKGGIN